MPAISSRRQIDDDSRYALAEGASSQMLAMIYRMSDKAVREKLAGVAPTGMRNGAPYWHLTVAGPILQPVVADFEAIIARMNHADLPPTLAKEFWNGLRAKQQYLITEGELWHTEEVVEKVGRLTKALRMGLLLLRDRVDRIDRLTPAQTKTMQELIDNALEDIRVRIRDEFRGEAVARAPARADSRQDSDPAWDL